MNQTIAYDLDQVMPAVIATGLLVSLFTAQSPSTTLSQSGVPDGSYTNVAGLVNIACTSPPESTASIKATEAKALAEIASTEFHHVLLDAWYSALDAGWRAGWRCVIDGTVFDIKGVESDSQMKMTRVCVQLVTT